MFITADYYNNHYPKKIVSLVPSQTELLHYLDLHDEVIGITKFCVHPAEWHVIKTNIGGTKNIDIEKIKSLQPHLIICNKEENVKEQVEALATLFPVFMSDVATFDGALQTIKDIGKITNTLTKALQLVNDIQNSFNKIIVSTINKPTAIYLIWNNPFMTIGGDTFINDMLCKAGYKNMFEFQNRYPTITINDIILASPNYLFLSSEPYPFKQKHVVELQAQLTHTKVVIVDGEMFSWYGSRMLLAATYFNNIIV